MTTFAVEDTVRRSHHRFRACIIKAWLNQTAVYVLRTGDTVNTRDLPQE